LLGGERSIYLVRSRRGRRRGGGGGGAETPGIGSGGSSRRRPQESEVVVGPGGDPKNLRLWFFLASVRLEALETSEEMARGCSHCGHNGHNSRTCPDRGVRLFGVRLTDAAGVMRKSASMSNLSHYYAGSSTSSANNNNNPPSPPEHSLGSGATPIDGYVSDGLVHTSNNARERKKGTDLHTHSSSSSSSHFLSVWPAGALSATLQ
jgi:hypothetical protein